MSEVLLGFSGGVDSFYSAFLLKEKGYKVSPVMFGLSGNENIEKAKSVAGKLGLKLQILDYREEFYETVVKKFIEYYKEGLTPNPCAICNRDMKMKKLYELSEKLGIEHIATGHYAKVEFSEKFNKKLIKRGVEAGKEQSYFLALISSEITDKLILPLGTFKKSQVMEKAKKSGYKFEGESQDICFIKEKNLEDFLIKHISPLKGVFTLLDGTKVGKFKNIYKYTVGQRKGLGISYGYPLYVIKIEPNKRKIIVDSKDNLLKDEFYIKGLAWHALPGKDELGKIVVQIRYRGKIAPVKSLKLLKNGRFFVKLTTNLDAPTPGQVCAFYYEDILLGGGEITTNSF